MQHKPPPRKARGKPEQTKRSLGMQAGASGNPALSIRAGTSGYSYKEWRGNFYPEDLVQDEWLGYFSSQLPAVEINNTFYRMPKENVVVAWRNSVPKDFQFVIKASRRITHQKRLLNTEEATGYLIQRAQTLAGNLGAVLFQLPPNMRSDLERLESFLSLLPEGFPGAFEFRHESWTDDKQVETLDAMLHQQGHTRVITHDSGPIPATLTSQPETNPFTYLRLRGTHYSSTSLAAWHRRIQEAGTNALIFFKHEEAGAGPALAARFNALSANPQPLRAKKKPGKRKLQAS